MRYNIFSHELACNYCLEEVSWKWLTSLAAVPKLAVHGVARFAVLRWAVNEDDDECLRLRLAGSLQAEQPCQLCGVRTRLYPLGLNFAPACEKCCHDHNINATTLHSAARWDTLTHPIGTHCGFCARVFCCSRLMD